MEEIRNFITKSRITKKENNIPKEFKYSLGECFYKGILLFSFTKEIRELIVDTTLFSSIKKCASPT